MRGWGIAREVRPAGGGGLLVIRAILQQGCRNGDVEGGGDLEGTHIAVDNAHVPPDPLNEPGVIGGVASARVGMLEHLTQESLRGLYAAQRLALGSRENATLVVNHLDGVSHGEAGNHSGVARAHGVDHPGEQIRGSQTPGGVVDQDNAVVVVQRREPCRHRGRPIGTSGHDIQAWVLTGDGAGTLKVGGRCHHDHVSDLVTTQNAPQCVSQYRLAAQRGECLGRPSAKSHTAAGGDQDHGNVHRAATFNA